MPQKIRIFRHYVPTPYLLMGLIEGLLVFIAVHLAFLVRFEGGLPAGIAYMGLVYAVIVVVSMTAMGTYEAQIREGLTGVALRAAVAIFLLASIGSAVTFYVTPALAIGRGALAISAALSFALIMAFRWLGVGLLHDDVLKRRILVLGTGRRAEKIASRMRRRSDRRGFVLVGFVRLEGAAPQVERYGVPIIDGLDEKLPIFCRQHRVHEIVVALDERRRNTEAGSGLPLGELLECRLRGIEICDIQGFIERETGRVDTDLLHPSWMVFSDGFVHSLWRMATKRSFDTAVSIAFLLIAWPFMLLTALAIWLESGFRGPVLYRQERVGLDGRTFNVVKFRSMRTDAEMDGKAVWATADDPRITRVGAFIRKTRLDEFPQVFNVLRGDMSFVGPRPERPEFVGDLAEKVPYYEQRHHVKPGLTGWAQLCYPYGASTEDSNEKLQYDLYYLKNHSVLLDMIILVQTVEVVLLGDGAR